jgi:hypothetical protein
MKMRSNATIKLRTSPLAQPISGIENRTPQEVFDIMSARMSHVDALIKSLKDEIKLLKEPRIQDGMVTMKPSW